MGKRDRKANEGSHQTFKKIPKASRNRINPLVKTLFEKCADIRSYYEKEHENFKELFQLIEEIRALEKESKQFINVLTAGSWGKVIQSMIAHKLSKVHQDAVKLLSDYVVPLPSRTNWDEFYQWCKSNGATIDGVSVQHIHQGEFGVIAQKDIQENDLYFMIPQNIIMSEIVARESKLGPLIKEDNILKNMPNVTLAIYLIMELLNENSFWKPYISVLPTVFNTILYFNSEEMELLPKSKVLEDTVHFCRSIARQYAYFRRLFQDNAYARSLNVGDYFTYDLYRWAVSVVMTRQNFLPIHNPEHDRTLALVPLWDMCNHSFGKPSSDFNLEKNCLEAYAMQDFKKGEEVFMFYGARENTSFFLHNGFVCLPNEYDVYSLKLGLSKSDPLFSKKQQLCEKNDVALDGCFLVKKRELIDDKLLLFLKINVLKQDELTAIFDDDSALFDSSEIGKEITKRALIYLRDRASLLLKCCKTTLQEDLASLSILDNPRKCLIVQLGISEKQTLQEVISYCDNEIANL